MNSLSSADIPPTSSRRRKRRGWSLRLTGGGVFLLMAVNLALLALIAWPVVQARARLPFLPVSKVTTPPAAPTASLTPSPSPTLFPSETPQVLSPSPSPLSPAPFPLSSSPQAPAQGLVILSLAEGLQAHLFAYQPQAMPLTRLTSGDWDDITPSLSPDGRQVAFASNRSGYWDLYLLDLATGQVTRLTDSLDYEANPSWSPDGRWLVHETYVDGSGGGLDLVIRSISGDQPPIRLTEHPAPDYAPAWSPQGRKIAFISTRSGEPEVWLADLDKAGEERFTDISQDSGAVEAHPAWSPDGSRLAWSAVEDGVHSLRLWDSLAADGKPEVEQIPRFPGSGDWPVWSPDGKILLAVLLEPNRTYLAAYPVDVPGIAWPPLEMPASIAGIAWGNAKLDLPLVEPLAQAAVQTPQPLWSPILTPNSAIPGGRSHLVPLGDVEAPYPMLQDGVDESFKALRLSLARAIGWDFLSSLENAYIPLTDPLDPGMGDDWLYTGRAFAFTPLPMNAGWMAVVREDFGLQAYWRVYLRARFQDGSSGMPLPFQPWDFGARTNGDPNAYEKGGALAKLPPPGFWIDFTRFAAAFGWERLPALLVWRSSYPAARFNEVVLRDGLDWRTAMLDLVPPQALITPTALVPPTRTLTPTPRWYMTSTPTPTSTPRPTLTPVSPTPTAPLPPTGTPTPPLPTLTPTRVPTFTRTPTAASSWTATPPASPTPTP